MKRGIVADKQVISSNNNGHGYRGVVVVAVGHPDVGSASGGSLDPAALADAGGQILPSPDSTGDNRFSGAIITVIYTKTDYTDGVDYAITLEDSG